MTIRKRSAEQGVDMKRGGFLYYWTAHSSISLAGVVYIMVLTTFMYQESGSAFIAALFPLFNAVARLVAGLTAPLVMEKFGFSKLLVRLQVMKALLLTALVIAFPTYHLRFPCCVCLSCSLLLPKDGETRSFSPWFRE